MQRRINGLLARYGLALNYSGFRHTDFMRGTKVSNSGTSSEMYPPLHDTKVLANQIAVSWRNEILGRYTRLQ